MMPCAVDRHRDRLAELDVLPGAFEVQREAEVRQGGTRPLDVPRLQVGVGLGCRLLGRWRGAGVEVAGQEVPIRRPAYSVHSMRS